MLERSDVGEEDSVMTKTEALGQIDLQLDTLATGALAHAPGARTLSESEITGRGRKLAAAKARITEAEEGDPIIDQVARELNM